MYGDVLVDSWYIILYTGLSLLVQLALAQTPWYFQHTRLGAGGGGGNRLWIGVGKGRRSRKVPTLVPTAITRRPLTHGHERVHFRPCPPYACYMPFFSRTIEERNMATRQKLEPEFEEVLEPS